MRSLSDMGAKKGVVNAWVWLTYIDAKKGVLEGWQWAQSKTCTHVFHINDVRQKQNREIERSFSVEGH